MDYFFGEIRYFGGNYAPVHWAFCDGQMLAITQNQALYSLIGTIYGGDGVSSFRLPDCQERVLVGVGQGPGLSNYGAGQSAGSQFVTLTEAQMPAHSHTVVGIEDVGNDTTPTGAVLARTSSMLAYVDSQTAPTVTLSGRTVGKTGGTTGVTERHLNVMPFLATSFIIALNGMYPQRN